MSLIALLVLAQALPIESATPEAEGGMTQETVDELVSAVLLRLASAPNDLPDHQLLPERGPVLIRQEIGDSQFKVKATKSSDLLRGRQLSIKPEATLQAEAGSAKQDVFFVIFDDVKIEGSEATLSIGVDVLFARPLEGIKTCCCSRTDYYRRGKEGRWKFVKHGVSICS